MNDDIDNLIKDLGLEDTEDSESEDQTKQNEEDTADVVHITASQLSASESLINKCKEIYQKGRENDLAWRWMIGQEVNDAYENGEKYEDGVLKKMSEMLDIAISDLSRFRKFYLSFDKDKVIDRAQVGYTWSHFKVINDLPDGDIKKRMIAQIEREDEAPKIKELQDTISEEKNSQLSGLDTDGGGLGGSTGAVSSSGPSPLKPVNSALKAIEKLNDCLTDILLQEEAGIEFDNDSKEEKYNVAIDELNLKLNETIDIQNKIWKDKNTSDKDDDFENEDEELTDKSVFD